MSKVTNTKKSQKFSAVNPRKMPVVDKIAIENAIAQLPDGYRKVFVLHDVEGYEHEEVAKILGC